MDSAVVAVPSLGTTIGAAYVGAMLSSLLFGITVLQVFIYYKDYPNDWRLYRYSVGIIWVLDAFHLSLTIHAIYHYTVDSFGDYVALGNVIWSYKLQILINVIIILFVQRYYLCCPLPLSQLTSSAIVYTQCGYGSSGAISIGSFLGLPYSWSHADSQWEYVMLVYKTFVYQPSYFPSEPYVIVGRYSITTFAGLASMKWTVDGAFATSTGIDFFISFAMCYYLHKSRSMSDFSSTNSRLLALMWFVLISGLATSACSTVALVTFIVLPNTLVFLGVEFLLTKLYVNSLLSMLNARKRIQGINTGSSAALSEPTSFSNIIRLTPTAGGGSVGDVKYDGLNIPLSEIRNSAPSQNNEDCVQIVEDKRSRVEFTMPPSSKIDGPQITAPHDLDISASEGHSLENWDVVPLTPSNLMNLALVLGAMRWFYLPIYKLHLLPRASPAPSLQPTMSSKPSIAIPSVRETFGACYPGSVIDTVY
ncbi:hypothetical protein DFS33DRAFT_1386553 [Desarmillaria ectypa]|nr:hypothetical protein DFS33DRAFT_1386553 [Desarmillaria ectypa]